MSLAINNTEILETAIFYHENNLCSFPLEYGEKKPRVILDNDKNPVQKKKNGKLLYNQFGEPEFLRESWSDFVKRPLNKAQLIENFSKPSNIAVAGGSVSGNLLIFDVDEPRIFENTLRYEKPMSALIEQAWVTQTPRGGQHFLVRTEFPVKTKDLKKQYGIELRSEGVYAAFPPSLFKRGQEFLQYHFLDDSHKKKLIVLNSTDIDQLINIGLPIEKATFDDKKIFHPFGLSKKIYEILFYGLYEKYGYVPKSRSGKSRSEAEYSIVLTLINNGWSYPEIENLFSTFASHHSKFKELNTRGNDYLHSCFLTASTWLKSNKSDIDNRIDRLFQIGENFNFEHRTKHTDKAVYYATLTIARKSGKINDISLPVRQIAEQAGISRLTAQRSIERIQSYGLIDNTRCNDLFHAREFSIIENISVETNSDNKTNTRYLHHDIFRHRGLGKSGFIIYNFLLSKVNQSYTVGGLKDWYSNDNDGFTWQEIVKETGISMKTVFRKLSIMKFLQIVENHDGKWKIVKNHNLDTASMVLGLNGTGERQRRFHESERKANQRSINVNELNSK
jgi:DNA-binding transcriptional regulator YhcF (GntR family)